MRKILSVVFAAYMLLTTVAFASPVTVATVETTKEVVPATTKTIESEGKLEESDEGQITTDLATEVLVYFITFGSLDIGAFDYTGGAIANYSDFEYNPPQNFPDVTFSMHKNSNPAIVEDETNHSIYMEISPINNATHTRWYIKSSTGSFPEGSYTIEQSLKSSTGSQKFSVRAVANGVNTAIGNAITASNAFSTFSRSFYIDGDTSVTEFQTYVDNSTAAWSLDNISLSYKAPGYTVTFTGNGAMPSPVEIVKNGYLVPSDFEVVSMPGSAVAFRGWSLTKDGEVLTEAIRITGDTTLYAVYEYKEVDLETESEYGKLAYYIDFDVASGTAIKACNVNGGGLALDNYTTYTVPYVSGMPATVELEAHSTEYYTDGENLVMKGTNYPRWWMAAYEEDGSSYASFPAGTYTVEYEIKCDTVNVLDNFVAVFGNPEVWSNRDWVGNATMFDKLSSTDYKKYTTSFTYDGSVVIDYNGKTVVASNNANNLSDMSKGLQKIGFYSGSGSTYNTYPRYYNWVKLWYEPLENDSICLTLDANGKNVIVPEPTQVGFDITFADYTLSDAGTSKFIGWAETPDGDAITAETKTYSEDITLYAVWDDYYYAPENEDVAGALLFHVHNNNMRVSNVDSQIKNYATLGNNDYVSGTLFPKINIGDVSGGRIWLGANNSRDTMKYGIGTVVPESYCHPDNELVITSVTRNGGIPVLSKVDVINNNTGYFANGIYTMAAEVYIPTNENIGSVTYGAYVNLANNDSRLVPCEDNALETGKKYYITDEILILDGNVYDPETMNAIGDSFTANTVNRVGFNFTFTPADGYTDDFSGTVHADNFRMYYRPYTHAPVSYNVNSIRTVAPAGIRFLSSISSVERENEGLIEYGFIVTRDVFLLDAGVSADEFTMESNVQYVKGVSFSKVDNIDKIYAKQNSFTFFTAVLYNIPASCYKDNVVVRPYVKIDGNIIYGKAMMNNIYDVAEKIKNSGGEEYENCKIAVDKILNCEEI